MANTYITNDVVAKLAIKEFKNNLVVTRTVDRQYQNVFSNAVGPTGTTIRIREPVRLMATPGASAQPQDIEQRSRDLTIDQRWNVSVGITDTDLALSLDSFQDSILRPAMRTLANIVDTYLYSKFLDTYDYVGTAGTAPNDFSTISMAGASLDARGVPKEDRYLILNSKDGSTLQNSLTNKFDPGFVDPILKERSMGRLGGFSAYTAQNIQRPFMQPITGTVRVNGINQTGTSIVLDGFAAGQVISKGQVFEIAGINSTNELSKNDTQFSAKFNVTQMAVADGTGNATLQIYPPLTPMGAYQNVTAAPADNALVTFQATHTINIAYNKAALTLAMINLDVFGKNEGVWAKNMVDESSNISMRVMRYVDGDNSQEKFRFDVLFGVASFPAFSTRVMGS